MVGFLLSAGGVREVFRGFQFLVIRVQAFGLRDPNSTAVLEDLEDFAKGLLRIR